VLTTERLLLAELPLSVVRQRLERPAFQANLALPDGPQPVIFPAAWPGDALGFFPALLETEASSTPQPGDDAVGQAAGGQFILIRRRGCEAIGLIGQKGDPDAHGDLEIGYGLNPDAWNQGYATEALAALLPYWLARPEVSRVTAETARTNRASARVLEKCGLVQVGES